VDDATINVYGTAIRESVMKRRFLRREHGAATVEFAITAIILFSLVFGIIEFSILLFDKHILTNASREGARVGVVMQRPRVDDTAIRNKVDEYAKEHMVSFSASSALNTTISPSQAVRATAPFGTEMIVTVKYEYKFLVLSLVGLNKIDLNAETRMRME
jgi:Flp pilus assembly protein TadG